MVFNTCIVIFLNDPQKTNKKIKNIILKYYIFYNQKYKLFSILSLPNVFLYFFCFWEQTNVLKTACETRPNIFSLLSFCHLPREITVSFINFYHLGEM